MVGWDKFEKEILGVTWRRGRTNGKREHLFIKNRVTRENEASSGQVIASVDLVRVGITK